MRTPIKSWEIGLFGLTLLCCFFVVVGLIGAAKAGMQDQKFINLGLDLRGGVDLTYEVQPPPGVTTITPDMQKVTKEILEKRIDPEGVKEILVQYIGTNRLAIQVPGESDPQRVKEMVGRTALLRFIDTSDMPNLAPDTIIEIEGEASTDPLEGERSADVEVITVKKDKIIVEGSQLKDSRPGRNPDTGEFEVWMNFNREGGKAFGAFTARHIGQPFSITLDNAVISSPTINDAIMGGSGRITGGFDMQGATDLATLLNSGALPVTLKLLSSQAVGPTLGAQAIRTSYVSFLIGIGLVAIFMIILYRALGLMAVLALSLYSLLTLGTMALFGATLTLPGIAGFILSIGMAVDANILVFERMKEEFNEGKAFPHALELGFERAFPAIVDGHLSSIITGILLYSLGTGTIKGFAVTLIIGNILSMYTSLFLTRFWILLTLQPRALHRPGLMGYGVKVVNG